MAADGALLTSVSRLALFADLEPDQLDGALSELEEISFNEGEWVLRRGMTDVGLYIIVDGEVGVLLNDEELAVLSKGSFFGEISALLDEPTVADVIARTPLRCLYTPADGVQEFLLANPKVMFRMLQTEARRLQVTDELRI
jgi:CRP-like cAMP-binding protein